MKNCPECGLDLPDEVLYCLYCGTRTSVSKSVKLNRKLFFLFPFFIILVSLAVTYDLGSLNFFESGLLISSALICLYFLGAFSLGIIKFFFKTSLDESSFFISAIFSLINAVASLFAVYSLANLFYSDYLDRLGPTALLKTFLLGIFAFYLIIEIIEILAIVLKSKYKEKTLINNTKGKAILANLWLWIPILYIILTITCYFNILEPSRIAFISRMLIFISSKERAAKYIDDGLKKYNNDAKLCYLKSVLLNESERLPSTQDIESEQEALKFAKIASQEKPDSPFYKYNLSIQYEINRNSEKAIAVAKEAAELAKEDAFLWQFLGDINNRHSNYSQSISAYKKSLEIDSNNAEVLNNLSYTLLIENKDVVVSKIAHGVPIGAEMEYIDALTLEMALEDRKKIS